MLTYSTEVRLFIPDNYTSPFNVGVQIEMKEFTPQETETMNELYDSPLRLPEELRGLHELVGGQPYLIRRCLYYLSTAVAGGTSPEFEEWEQFADRGDGFLGDHLCRLIMILERNVTFRKTVAEALRGKPCSDLRAFFALRSAGILSGDPDSARLHNRLYERYLTRYL